MLNRVTLIGTVVDEPEATYDPHGNKWLTMILRVPLPPDAPPTYRGLGWDMRDSITNEYTTGDDDAFLLVCRDLLLVERCLESVHKGEVVFVEGRLVLTGLRPWNDGEVVRVAEILAGEVVVLSGTTQS